MALYAFIAPETHLPGWAPGLHPGAHLRAYLGLHLGPLAGAHPDAAVAAVYAIALALTLVLAAWLTPRHWWRRPTVRGGALLAGGTLAFGTLFLALAGQPQPALAAGAAPAPALSGAPGPAAARAALPGAPASGASYRVAEELNLRATGSVHGARLAVLPAGSRVVASGAVDGDWWQVRARIRGRELTGWTSSLWLRRNDEASRRGHDGG